VIPEQEDVDYSNPEEHVSWALRNMPTFAGVGAVTHPGFLRQWSRHLVDCGFAHCDYLASLADENGNIHVSKLPKQRIKLRKAIRGPRNHYNPAATWVPVNAPEPPKTRIPDISNLTLEENMAMLQQYRNAGLIVDPVVGPPIAVVEE
jgi:hypothetical protein